MGPVFPLLVISSVQLHGLAHAIAVRLRVEVLQKRRVFVEPSKYVKCLMGCVLEDVLQPPSGDRIAAVKLRLNLDCR